MNICSIFYQGPPVGEGEFGSVLRGKWNSEKNIEVKLTSDNFLFFLLFYLLFFF